MPNPQIGDLVVAVFNITASPPVAISIGKTEQLVSGPADPEVFGVYPRATGFDTFSPPGGGFGYQPDAIWQQSTDNLSANTYLAVIGIGNALL
jgi:hypothetical protein